MHSLIEKIRRALLSEIQNKLRTAWNLARMNDEIAKAMTSYDLENNPKKAAELQQAEQKSAADKLDRIGRAKIEIESLQQSKTNELAGYTQKRENLTREIETLRYRQTLEPSRYDSVTRKLGAQYSSELPQENSLKALEDELKKCAVSQSKAQQNIADYGRQFDQRKREIEGHYAANLVILKKKINEQYKLNRECEELKQKGVYDQIFIANWSNTYDQVFTEQFDAFLPEMILIKLLSRHSWLRTQIRGLRGVPMYGNFLLETLRTQFFCCLNKEISINYWSEIDLKVASLHWSPIDDNWLEETIQGYPLSSQQLYEHNQFLSCVVDSGWLSVPTRYDLYQVVINANAFSSRKCKGEIFCNEIVPIHVSEIQTLSQEEKSHIQILFLNIASEENPRWVLLHKIQGHRSWNLYVPAEFEKEFDGLGGLKLGTIHKNIVDLTPHCQFNDLSVTFSIDIAWHAVMVSRVFTWCRMASPPPLTEYRRNVPASLLLESTLIQCISPFNRKGQAKLRASFANAAPYSNYSVVSYYKDVLELSPEHHLLDDPTVLMDSQAVNRVLDVVESSKFELDAHKHSLTFNGGISQDQFSQGIKLTERFGLSTLVLSVCDGVQVLLRDESDWRQKMVTRNLQITTVSPGSQVDLTPYAYLYHCAARNRFMQQSPNWSKLISGDVISLRKRLWEETGKAIVSFFENNTVDLDRIEEVIEFNRAWRETFCSNNCRPLSADKAWLWAFVQWAQMGSNGLQIFFNTVKEKYAQSWHPIYRENSPNLCCVFDLQGSLAELLPADYTKELITHIKNFDPCAPLFKEIALILPDKLDAAVVSAIGELLVVLHKRKLACDEEPDELVLYNLNISDEKSELLLNQFHALQGENKLRLQVSIQIPAWDRLAVYEQMPEALRYSSYQALQNWVANNVRYARFPILKKYTTPMVEYIGGNLRPTLVLENHEGQISRVRSEKDVAYPLTSGSPNIQQQLQQQIAQEYQHQAEKQRETVKEKEVEREIGQYSNSEADLITRENIHERGQQLWLSIPENIQKRSGLKPGDKLDKLFSLWVGSFRSATFVIERIHPQAMEKLMNFAPNFRFGRDWNRTPGFRVSRSIKDNALILTYNARLEKNDLMAQQESIRCNDRDPFAMQLKSPKPASVFRGNYLQFLTLIDDPMSDVQSLQTQWRYLAKEKADQMRDHHVQTHAARLCSGADLTLADASVTCARYNVSRDIVLPGDYHKQIEYLKNWACSQYPGEQDFVEALCHDFNESRLQAFGQLFNCYDSTDTMYEGQAKAGNSTQPFETATRERTFTGTGRWLMLAHEIYHTFPKHLGIWKRRLLDEREDWSEILDQEEVYAMVCCMASLKDKNETYQDILWALVDAHGHAVGSMQFSEIWYGFEKFVQYIEEQRLTIHPDAFLSYLNATQKEGNFNATEFLFRLCFVMKHVANKQDSYPIQQEILNNIPNIDWTYSGFYYACCYAQYRYWTNELMFTGLAPFLQGAPASYRAIWDHISLENIDAPITYALRFAARNMELDRPDCDLLTGFLTAYQSNFESPIGKQVLRVLLASLAIGVDRLERTHLSQIGPVLIELNQASYAEILLYINQALLLDQSPLIACSYHMRLADLPVFAEMMRELFTKNFIENLNQRNIPFNIHFLNICGHALHCYERQKRNPTEKKAALLKLLQFVMRGKSLDHALVSTYPWLIDDAKETSRAMLEFRDPMETAQQPSSVEIVPTQHQKILQRQLQSINLHETTWFPSLDELTRAFVEVSSDQNADFNRRNSIDRWIKSGCAIVDQDAPYRPLTHDEINAIKQNRHLQLSMTYGALNKPLFDCLAPFLAVRIDDQFVSLDHQIKPLLDLFSTLDSKMYYNDLGQILGALIHGSGHVQNDEHPSLADPRKRYYAIEQLTLWLHLFFDRTEFAKKPYPVEFLKEILLDAVCDAKSSLLNHQMVALKSSDETCRNLLPLLKEITQSGLAYRSQQVLVKLIIKFKHDPSLRRLSLLYKDMFLEVEQASNASLSHQFSLLVEQLISKGDITDIRAKFLTTS